jgi:hypothetical protein
VHGIGQQRDGIGEQAKPNLQRDENDIQRYPNGEGRPERNGGMAMAVLTVRMPMMVMIVMVMPGHLFALRQSRPDRSISTATKLH